MASDPNLPVGERAARSGALVVLGLGINAWLSSALFVLLAAEPSARTYAVGASALVWLGLGAIALVVRVRGGNTLARWLLLAVYPAALGIALTIGTERMRETAHGAFSMSLCAAALLAYLIAAALACKPQLQPLEVESHPLSNLRNEGPPGPTPLRRIVIALVLVGAFAIAVIAPLSPPYPALAAAWGDAASDAGAALSALVASATAVSLVAVHLGAALRREARSEPARVRQKRIVTLLLLTLLGFATYVTVIP
jgi:hypothetical protein